MREKLRAIIRDWTMTIPLDDIASDQDIEELLDSLEEVIDHA